MLNSLKLGKEKMKMSKLLNKSLCKEFKLIAKLHWVNEKHNDLSIKILK